MNDESQLLDLVRTISEHEGKRRTAGRLFNIAALLLAENGVSDDELALRLKAAFLRFNIEDIYGARH